jgi:uncharacterized protein
MKYTSDVAFTDAVKRIQSERGSRTAYANMEKRFGGFEHNITPELVAFLAERDSVYLATANAPGQPYIQHRGGSPGFIKVVSEGTLGIADFFGNRQYISTGNLEENDRAYLFLMNYAARERIKIWGTAHIVKNDAELFAKLKDPTDPSRIEQAILFKVEAWDGNCPQHIPVLVHARLVREVFETQRMRIETLEAFLRAANVPFEPHPIDVPDELLEAFEQLRKQI